MTRDLTPCGELSGLWSDQMKNFCPSNRYLKCLMAATQASNSLSKVL